MGSLLRLFQPSKGVSFQVAMRVMMMNSTRELLEYASHPVQQHSHIVQNKPSTSSGISLFGKGRDFNLGPYAQHSPVR